MTLLNLRVGEQESGDRMGRTGSVWKECTRKGRYTVLEESEVWGSDEPGFLAGGQEGQRCRCRRAGVRKDRFPDWGT